MFDPDTSKLISDAPSLDGLDLSKLSAQLTDAYTLIVTARVRMREAAKDSVLPDDIMKIATQMRRIAFTNEAFVSALPGREDRAAAAFVAGAAHHVSLMAARMVRTERQETRLMLNSIAPEVSATLLFLIAEATADSAEMAKEIVIPSGNTVEGNLLNAIVDLSKGDLTNILVRALPNAELLELGDLGDRGVSALYYLLLIGVRQLALELLGSTQPRTTTENATSTFRHIKNLCVEQIEIEGQSIPAFSAFPGPHHLASLLVSVADNLTPSAIVNIAPPGDVNATRWATILGMIAERRPYLWRNHRKALESGYLETGISSAISFPTGAGKSTLSELKVAATMLRGKKVVFLAPTLALVEQTASALKQTFPDASIEREQGDTSVFDDLIRELPTVSVMTTERCLALLGYDAAVFSDVGLLVFDECHLMHAASSDKSHRAIDAMLCVLNFVTIAPMADLLLLSAMMQNTKEIAEWVSALTARRCLALDLNWKPTRQVRGCVVYDADRIAALNSTLNTAYRSKTTIGVPSAVSKTLTAQPFGLFSLKQTWESKRRLDYRLVPLLEQPLALGTDKSNQSWYLTSNGIQVASALAIAAVANNVKTLVFIQTIPHTNSAAKQINNLGTAIEISLSDKEIEFLDEAVEELGDASHTNVSRLSSGLIKLACVCHHSLLLPAERRLHESLFKRDDGVKIMVATSTLAQGMNLPSEVVIIAGDSRFDSDAEKFQQLEAHELLNAAGRAGRAGESSYGVVLVVPSKVIDYRDQTGQIGKHWQNLQTVFAQSDQCVLIDDPMEALLDQLQLSKDGNSPALQYFLRRLPVGTDGDKDSATQALLNKSFAAFRRRAADKNAWIDGRISAVLAARVSGISNPTWVDQLASTTGVPAEFITALGLAINAKPLSSMASVEQWRDWVLEWLKSVPYFLPVIMRPATLEAVLGKPYRELTKFAERGQHFLNYVDAPLKLWMAGSTLAEIELGFGTPFSKLGKCDAARKFVLRIVPEFAYLVGLPLQVIRAMEKGTEREQALPGLGISVLSSCVRFGFDIAEKLALRQIMLGRRRSRVLVHKSYAMENVPPANGVESLEMAKQRVSEAILITL